MKSKSSANSAGSRPPTKMEILRHYLKKFYSLFPTDKDRKQALFHLFTDEKGIQCKHCGSRDVYGAIGERYGTCRSCGKNSSFTAGTLFNRIRKVHAWLLAIWLMGQGITVNANQLHILANIAAATASEILKRISLVINTDMVANCHAVSVFSVSFSSTFLRRSRETPANEHPIAEQAEMEKRELETTGSNQSTTTEKPYGEKNREATSTHSASELSGPAKKVFDFLSTQPLHLNYICKQTGLSVPTAASILVQLELEGLVETVFGDRYILSTAATATSLAHASAPTTAVDNIIEHIRRDFQGISRKYLQLYLAAHWCRVDRGRWSFESLLKACRSYRDIRNHEIRAFVSPLVVKVML
jgi:DNA-binding MarR family transcriptional regulator